MGWGRKAILHRPTRCSVTGVTIGGVDPSRADPRPYFPPTGKSWRWTMGLRALDLSAWLEVDQWRSKDLLRKAALLAEKRSVVVGTSASASEAGHELWDEVKGNLAAFHPRLVEARDDALADRVTGIVADDPDPVVRAASIVQEDLCVLEKTGDEWILTSACVCFPSRWSLASKIGTSMDAIHAPIPLYDSKLARPVNLFFDRLTPGKPVWRLNWSVLDTDELSLTDPAERRADSGVTSIDDLWFRVERQTLRRLPHSGAVIFTIRTYVDHLSAILEGDPHRREALRIAFETIDPETAVYKGWGHFLEVLRADLVRP